VVGVGEGEEEVLAGPLVVFVIQDKGVVTIRDYDRPGRVGDYLLCWRDVFHGGHDIIAGYRRHPREGYILASGLFSRKFARGTSFSRRIFPKSILSGSIFHGPPTVTGVHLPPGFF